MPMVTHVPVPPLPGAHARAMALLMNLDSSMAEVAAIIEADPGLTASVLRAANSAASGTNTPIVRVADAHRAHRISERALALGRHAPARAVEWPEPVCRSQLVLGPPAGDRHDRGGGVARGGSPLLRLHRGHAARCRPPGNGRRCPGRIRAGRRTRPWRHHDHRSGTRGLRH
ncbi:MAG: HDOD domain-containing protein [Dehalococcoidia bacterium]|nr:HDOD domain-containing protein [Dehalococcoidia bacterium]